MPRRWSSSRAGNSVSSDRDDDLAAAVVGNAVLLAEAVHGLAARDAVARFERARLVVEAGMDDAAVVAGLVGGQAVLGLQNDQR